MTTKEKPYKASAKLVDYLKKREKLMLEAYLDQAGRWTIGYGHLILPGEKYHPFGSVKKITPAQALALFKQDLQERAVVPLNRLLSVPLTQNQADAVISFVFNTGEGAFAGSTMLKRLRGMDFANVPPEFGKWIYVHQNGVAVKSEGLIARRQEEMERFLTA